LESPAEIAPRLLHTQYVSDAVLLVQAVGGDVGWTKRENSADEELILRFRGQTKVFKSEYEMTQWVIREIASAY
jgi:hypothetical protein